MRKYFFQRKTYRRDTIQEIREINSLCSWGILEARFHGPNVPKKFSGMACPALYKHLQHSQAAKLKPFV